MRVVDKALLAVFRSAQRCEWCGKATPEGCHPHHLWGRGLGGGSRLDIRLNLAALCARCHRLHHDGHRPLKCDLLAIVAAREHTTQDRIERVVYKIRRTPKP